jgi:hypothetical protein
MTHHRQNPLDVITYYLLYLMYLVFFRYVKSVKISDKLFHNFLSVGSI